MMSLSLPTSETMMMFDERKVIDCGAGDGLWLEIMRRHGIDAIGIDPDPRGPGVRLGSCADLGKYKDRDLLLIVWPPDGTRLEEWFKYWNGGTVAVCGNFERFECPPIKPVYIEAITGGMKGRSTLIMGYL